MSAFALFASLGFGCAAEPSSEDMEDAVTSPKKLTPADVSILLPLPEKSVDESLSPTTLGKASEELLPASAYLISPSPGRPEMLDPLFYFTHGAPMMTPANERAALRLTAVRLDPCGRVAPSDPASSCVPEVRLVFQPVLKNSEGIFEAADAAVHAFYRVSAEELGAFAKKMFAARNSAGGFSYSLLGVHPTLSKEGLTGKFAKSLFAELKQIAGATNLERVTFLQRTPSREPVWVFGITSVSGKKAKVEKIATTDSTLQALEGPGFGLPTHFTNISGAPGAKATETGSDDKVSAILDTRTSTEEAQVRALNATVRIDNPTIHSPATMSCVECHVATGARQAFLERKPSMKAAILPANVWKAPMSTKRTMSNDVDNLHAFSWKGTDIGISERTANESASIAAKMNAILF